MKKIIFICLCLVLIMSLAACGSKNALSENKKIPAESNVPKKDAPDEKVNIKVSMPEGWTAVTGSVIPVHYMKNTASVMIKKENFSSKSLDDVVLEAKGIFNNSFKDVKYIGGTESITIDGKEAKKFIMTCSVSNLSMKYEYVYIIVNKDVYAITFGDLAKTFDSYTQEYEQILKNVSFQ